MSRPDNPKIIDLDMERKKRPKQNHPRASLPAVIQPGSDTFHFKTEFLGRLDNYPLNDDEKKYTGDP